MLIGFDARMFGPKHGGIGRYAQQLISNLIKIDKKNQYVFFTNKESEAEIKKIINGNHKIVVLNIGWYTLSEQLNLAKKIYKENLDLMHFPHWNIPLRFRGKFVVTVHDLIMFHFKRSKATTLSPIVYWFKDKIHRIVVRNAVKKANYIITPSQFTKHDIIKTLKTPAKKIKTIHLAPFEKQIENGKLISLNKLGICKPFVLYVGSAYPHKNLDRLIKAWRLLESRLNNKFDLVLVGKNDYFYKKITKSKNYLKAKNIIFTGFLSDTKVVQLYKQAQLYIFPSLYEGFGLPAIEALQYNLPVASSDAACLPEILKNNATFFNPHNIYDISDKMAICLKNKEIKMNYSTLLRDYSWKKTAQKTLKIYNQLSS